MGDGYRSALFCFACLVFAAAFATAEENLTIEGIKHIDFIDGSSLTRYLVREAGSDRLVEMSLAELKSRIPAAAWQQMVVIQTYRWRDGVKNVNFELTPLAKNNKKKFRSIIQKLKNKRRGSSAVPKLRLTNKVAQLEAGTDQFWDDSKNTLVMTGDDRYFQNMPGVAAYVVYGVDYIYSADSQAKQKVIREVDAFFPEEFFWQSTLFWQMTIVHEFGHVLGYQHSCWTNDYMSYCTQMINSTTLWEKDNCIWDLSKERDRLYYPDDETEAAEPRLLPFDDSSNREQK